MIYAINHAVKKYLLGICCCLFLQIGNSQDTAWQDSLFQIIQTSENDTVFFKTYYKIIWNKVRHGEYEDALKFTDAAYQKTEQIQSPHWKARTQFYYGVIYRLQKDFEKAILYLDSNIVFFAESTPNMVSTPLWHKSAIFLEQGKFEKAISINFQILENFQQRNKQDGVGSTLLTIAGIYKEINDFPKAKQYLIQAITVFKNKEDWTELATAYHNLGGIYEEITPLDSAKQSYFLGLEMAKKANYPIGIINNQNGLARYYDKNGDTKSAIQLTLQAIDLAKAKDLAYVLDDAYPNLAAFYLKDGNRTAAIKYAKITLADAQKRGSFIDVKRASKLLADCYEQQGQFQKSNFYFKEYLLYKDSSESIEQLKNIDQLTIQYETEKKDKELALNQLQLKENELTILAQQQRNQWYLGLGFLLLAALLTTSYFFRQNQQQKNAKIENLLQEQTIIGLKAFIEGEEKERNRLAKDLHDGINGDLAAIKLQLEGLDKTTLVSKSANQLADAIGLLDDACQQVRLLSHSLVAVSIENFGLRYALEQYCSKMQVLHNLDIQFVQLGTEISLSKHIQTVLYRIVQELINNMVKHAQATEALVQMSYQVTDNLIELVVEDNGIGFDMNHKKGGIGLSNVRSRVAYLGGNLEIESSQVGTTFFINIDTKQLPRS